MIFYEIHIIQKAVISYPSSRSDRFIPCSFYGHIIIHNSYFFLNWKGSIDKPYNFLQFEVSLGKYTHFKLKQGPLIERADEF